MIIAIDDDEGKNIILLSEILVLTLKKKDEINELEIIFKSGVVGSYYYKDCGESLLNFRKIHKELKYYYE